MRLRTVWLTVLLACGVGCTRSAPAAMRPALAEQAAYYPRSGDQWERRRPQQVGMDSARLAAAMAFAVANETPWPRDIAAAIRASGLASGPHGEIVGPVRDREGPSGLVIRNGYIVAEWGDTRRADITFSIAKSNLATLAGLALDQGLIPARTGTGDQP